ncbi:MAG TPA: GxxExxY protein [Kiritimatiellia bacterium]|nr:GxxExxY protein [Kiritimatiellia bacterium]
MTETCPYAAKTYEIIGACFEVYNNKGCGFLEAVYQHCMEIELELRGIPFAAQPTLCLEYKGRQLPQGYQPDLLCYEKVVVEIKAVSQITDEHRAQLLNYLHATGRDIGLLVNFGHFPGLQFERSLRNKSKDPSPHLCASV